MRTRSIAVISFFLGVTGCGTITNRYAPENLNFGSIPPASGVLIMSAGAPESCTSTSTQLWVHKPEAKYGATPEAGLRVDGSSRKSDFADHHGYVHVVALPAGDYYMAPIILNPYVKALRASKASFSIAAGEILYMGEYWMPVSCVFNPVSIVRDQEERDLNLVALRNPQFDRSKVVKRLANFSECAVGCE